MKSLIHIFIITVLFLGITGCGLKDGDERSHPFFKRAVKAQKANELGLAIKYFNRYLTLKPDSSRAHLRLASIYDENLDKPLHAVYHYERFLEFAPKSSQAGTVKKWQEAALKKYYYRTRQKLNDPEDVGVLQNSLYLTEEKLKKERLELKKIKLLQKKLIKYAREIRANEKMLKAKLSELEKTHQSTLDELEKTRKELKEKKKEEETAKKVKAEETDILEKKKEKKTAKPEEKAEIKIENKSEEKTEIKIENKSKDKEEKTEIKGETKPEEKEEKKEEKRKSLQIIPKAAIEAPPFAIKKNNKTEIKTDKDEVKTTKNEVKNDLEIRSYRVQKGDSLSKISRQFYGSSKYYKLIFEANREILSSEKDLRPGQVLKIPAL